MNFLLKYWLYNFCAKHRRTLSILGLMLELSYCHAAELKQNLKDQTKALWAAVNQRGILLPAVFVFLWQVGRNCHRAFLGFIIRKLLFKLLPWTLRLCW